MKIYIVDQITEADFGCEDTGRKEPTALLRLKEFMPETLALGSRLTISEHTDQGLTESSEYKYIEMTEAKLAKYGISECKKVCFTENGELKRYVRVVAAVIRKCEDGAEKIFATARGYGDYKGWWEFPGGKIEPGETPEQALAREIKEELIATIEVQDFIQTVEYDYPEFYLSMDCFWAVVKDGELVLKEAEAARWLSVDELDSVKWLPADEILVNTLKKLRVSL